MIFVFMIWHCSSESLDISRLDFVAEVAQFSGNRGKGLLLVLNGLGAHTLRGNLLLVVGRGSDLTLELKLLNNITILPSDLRGQTAENAECTSGAKTEYTEGVRDDHALSLVIRRRDTLEDLKTGKSLLTTNSLVGNHTANSAPEDLGGRSQVEGSSLGVDVATLAQERVVVVLVLLEDTRDLHLLATNNNNALSVQDLLRDDGGQAAQKVATAVDDNFLLEHCASKSIKWEKGPH